jgi:hypothetical protein
MELRGDSRCSGSWDTAGALTAAAYPDPQPNTNATKVVRAILGFMASLRAVVRLTMAPWSGGPTPPIGDIVQAAAISRGRGFVSP